MWQQDSCADYYIPLDLDWDRVTAGKTRKISYYKGHQLSQMFHVLAEKALYYESFEGFNPHNHSKNCIHKLFRMAYQICCEGRYNGKQFCRVVVSLSDLMEEKNINPADCISQFKKES